MLLTECYQKLSPWLCAPLDRKSRSYLETHLALLADEFVPFLEAFVSKFDGTHDKHHLEILYDIWQEARARGSTQQAVSEAYVNTLGGLILDIPDWLCMVERQQHTFFASSWTERSLTIAKMQLHAGIERAMTEDLLEPETIAELQYQLGNCFVYSSRYHPMAVLQTAARYYRASLQIYSASRYPRQYTKVLLALNTVLSNLLPVKNQL